MSPIKTVKKQSLSLLYSDWFSHIAVFFGFSVILTGIGLAGFSVLSLLELYAELSEASYNLLEFFFVFCAALCSVPLLYGLGIYAANVANGHKADVMDLFYAFGSGRVFCRSFSLWWGLVWRFALNFAIPFYLLSQAEILLYEEDFLYTDYWGFDLGYFLVAVGLFLAFYIALAVYARNFCAIYLTLQNENIPVSVCFSAAAFLRKTCPVPGYAIRLCFSYLPLVILSMATFGLLFIVYTLPLMLIAFFVCAKKQSENAATGLYAGALFDSFTPTP